MAAELSAEQVREKHIRDMGPELGPVYHELSDEVAWLHAKWNQYRQLFGHSEERVDLLNRVGGHFFRIVQDALWDNVILHIARLTDTITSGPKSSPKDNLTLRRLPEVIPNAGRKKEVEALIDTALLSSSFARDWRNRSLAHIDLKLALQTGANPLPGISREQVENTLSAFRSVLNKLDEMYWQSETAYEHFMAAGGEGDDVIFFIRAGLKAEDARMERLRQGKPLPEDLNEP
jgi:hypothetical protein